MTKESGFFEVQLPELKRFSEKKHRDAAFGLALNSVVRAVWIWVVMSVFIVLIFAIGFLDANGQITPGLSHALVYAGSPLAAFLWFWAVRKRMRQYLRRLLLDMGERICLECGYDLTGNESGTCPECGTDIEQP